MSILHTVVSDSAALRERALKVLPGGSTRSTLFVAPHPPYAVKGNGAFITDNSGREVLDCNNNYTSLIHGHNNPAVREAAVSAMDTGTAFGLPTAAEIDFAELLSNRVGLGSWRFCNSGTEAVMMAIRAARAFTGRSLLVRFDGSYHGTSDAVVDAAAPGIPDGVIQEVIVLPQGDEKAFTSLMGDRGNDIAAVLIDLMPNRAGLVPADPNFIDLVREATSLHGSLMIVDEVITLRLGLGGLHQKYGITPDIVTVAKVIGGGFPAGAIAARPEVLEPFNPLHSGAVGWGGTFSANPVTLRAGQKAMELFDEAAIDRLNSLGNALREALVNEGIDATGFGSLLRLNHPNKSSLWWSLYSAGVLAGTNGLIALSTPMNESNTTHIFNSVVSSYKELS